MALGSQHICIQIPRSPDWEIERQPTLKPQPLGDNSRKVKTKLEDTQYPDQKQQKP